jgi:hypothetical protein
MNSPEQKTGSAETQSADGDVLNSDMHCRPAVGLLVKEILNRDPRCDIISDEDVNMAAAIHNLKRWCSGF